ncbi:hypothetical protein HUW51_08205 [Adhaeribacter swui]|uniref:Uncharacterized protein n=1 Tax=Adhaeribacter swui TaxID=2086471 RepID=A0A7G7G6C9_9BACT|nr:hypothetical protein [Adhaeribacter swui]QNF32713.1 hypothetical protein HUW51_08205 [Adhaeribacter swui]
MDPYYANKMANKTELELLEYFNNHQKYVPVAVLAAVAELQKRGRTFSETELATLEPERQAVRQAYQAEMAAKAAETDNDEEAEEVSQLYTPNAIVGFSIFFSLLFGAMLLVTNIRELGNRKGSWIVVGFGIAYMALEVVLFQLYRSSTLTLGLNLIGALILNFYFWPKYIGFNQGYEAKPIWRALLISILIVLPLIIIASLLPQPE